MPSKSRAQHNLMEAAAHTKGGYGGVSQKVGKEFAEADESKKFAKGGLYANKGKIMAKDNNFKSHVYDTKTDEIHITYPTWKKATNAMSRLNDKHEGYETPGNLIQSKFGAKRDGYAKGGDIDLKKCKVSTHEKCKSCKDW